MNNWKDREWFLNKTTRKRLVKFLSCVVVFCTTYALVLPAITEEAKAYCHVPEHHHTLECYQTIQTCSQHEHTHDDFCYDENGSLICTQAEHSHDDSCYEKQLDCDQIEHTHSLICFSNPDADLETIQDWKQDTNEALFFDDQQEERSAREKITAIAAHQVGNKESHDNYQVADDGKTRIGITRYGQWDDDPYQENWSSSFVRYVLHFAQADEATKDAPKDLYDWMSQLSDSQQLLTIDNAESGDVLFVLDQKDTTIAKAAIIEQEDENELVAIGQDAKDEVARQTYNRNDPLLHSIYKPVETSKGIFEENTPEDKKSVSKSPAADEEADNSKTPYNQNANPKSSDDEIKDNELALFDSNQKDSEFEDEKPNAFLKNNKKPDMKQTDTDDDNDAETNNSEKEQDQKTLDEKTSDAAKSSTSSPSGKDSNHLQTSTSKSDDLTNPTKNDANKSSTSSKSSLNNTTPSGSDKKDSQNSEESKTSKEDQDESSKEADSKNVNSQTTNKTNHSDQHQADDDDLAAGKQIIDIQTVQKDSEQTKAEAIADDGTIVQAKWNPETFEEETVVFQAKVKQTDPAVEKQVLTNLPTEEADQYQAITYDLTFYRRGENAELEEIEPKGTVLVTFGFTQDIKHVDSIYHYPASKRLEKMNLEQVNNSADQKEANEVKQTQNRIPESPKAKQSSSNALTSLDKEDNAQDSTNSNGNASQASETSKDQDSNLESNQGSKPESSKPSSGSKSDSDTDSDSKSTNQPVSYGDSKPGESLNSESQPDSEQNNDIDPADTKESEPSQAADSIKESQTNPDQTSSAKSTAKQVDQTVTNSTDSTPVSSDAVSGIRTSITAALKQSLQTKSVPTNSQVENEAEDKNIDTTKNSTVKSSSSSSNIESDNILDSDPSATTSASNTEISEPTAPATHSSFEAEFTDLTLNSEIQIVQFETDSFSEYVAVLRRALASTSETKIDSLWRLNNEYHTNSRRNFYLEGNVSKDNDGKEWNTTCYLNKGGNVTIDLNGFAWQTKGTIIVSDGTTLTITNSKSVSTNQNNYINNNDKYDINGPSGTTRIKYADKEGNLKMAIGGGVIVSDGIALRVEGSTSKLVLENGVGIISNGQEAIVCNNGSKTELYHSYICSSKVGVSVHFGARLALKNGSVISLNSNPNDRGGGIYADDIRWGTEGGLNNDWYGARVTMEAGSLVSSNTAQTGGGICIGRVKAFENKHGEANGTANYSRTCFFTMTGGVIAGNVSKTFEGAGLALQYESFSRAVLYGGEFYKNRAESGSDWGGGGIFVSEYNYLWMPHGASIYENTSEGLGGGLTGCATGKMIIDPSLRVFQNTAHGSDNGFPDTSEKIKAYNYKDRIDGYWGTAEGYKGEDIFGADKTQLSGQFKQADGTLINAKWQGNVDKTFTIDNDGTTLNATDWLTVKCMLPDNQTDPLKSLGVQIHGNTSKTHGAGMLVNGWLVTGDVDTSYMGKSFGVEGFKQLIDEASTDMTLTPGQFHFKITETNDRNASAIATGTNNEAGKITFQSKIPVGDDSRKTYTFYLMEDKSQLPAGYEGSDNIYEIEVTVDVESKNTFTMYEWDPDNDIYTAKEVTIITNKITDIRCRLLPSENWTRSNLDTVTIGNYENPTFINKLKNRTSIRVKKAWTDGADKHTNDVITVNLLQSGVIKESVRLSAQNNWQYTWNNLPLFEEDTSYTYRVEEETPEGYIRSIAQTGTIDAVAGTPTSAYIPASKIEDDKEYYIIASDNNFGLQNNGTSIKQVDIARYKIKGYNAYSTDLTNSGVSRVIAAIDYETHDSSNNNKKKVNALHFEIPNDHYLASSPENPGLRILNYEINPKYYDSQDPGFCISSEDLSLKTGKQETDPTTHKLVYYNNGFRTENYLPSNEKGGKVQLFELGTINTGGTSSGVEYTITNTPISNALTVTKTDSADEKHKLADAIFTLYTDETCQTAVKVTGGNGTYQYSPGSNDTELKTSADGQFTLTNLPEGTFYLKEIQAPNGYKIVNSTAIKIEFSNTSQAVASISIGQKISNELITFELPETGGLGTDLITYRGAALILASGGLYITSRKQRRKQSQ